MASVCTHAAYLGEADDISIVGALIAFSTARRVGDR